MKKIKTSGSLVFLMLALVMLLLVLPIAISGYYLYAQITDNLTQMERERVQISNQATQKLIQKFGDSLLDGLTTNSNWEDFRVAVGNNDVKWINENINVAVDIVPNVDFIATADFNGKVLSQAGDVNEFTGSVAELKIAEHLKMKNDFSGLVQTSKGLAVIAVSNITNEEGNAEPTGMIIFGRLLDEKALGEIKETLRDDIALLTTNGTMLSTSSKVGKEDLSKYLSDREQENVQVFKTSQSGSVDSAQMITSLKDFTGKSIGVLYSNEIQVTSTAIKSNLINTNLMIGGVLIIILVILSVVVFKRIITPIQQLVNISEQISTGDLSNEVNQKVANRRDELGKLGQAMNGMISSFRGLIKEVEEAIEHVASSSEQLSASSEETTKETHRIAAAIQEIASGSEIQLQGATESTEAIEEMTKGIQQIADTVSNVSADSTNAEKEIMQGKQTIVEAVQQMENINDSFEESAEVITQLTERSKEIGQIALLITTISDQTNLLALNATIEAARAGEQGKGFAVVADEVRRLAEQTADSAKQVSELIAVIQRDSVSSVQSMDKVNKEVHEGVKQIHEVGNVFEKILLTAQNVAEQTQEASAVSEQISASTRQVASTVETMAKIAKSSASSSHSVAQSAQEQLASMEENASSSESLTNMAQELKGLIAQFKRS
ncbi:HAMP domain-containing protein [Priestia megaterium]|nr:HAMP domain-containing protein [Priestia megaterium]